MWTVLFCEQIGTVDFYREAKQLMKPDTVTHIGIFGMLHRTKEVGSSVEWNCVVS